MVYIVDTLLGITRVHGQKIKHATQQLTKSTPDMALRDSLKKKFAHMILLETSAICHEHDAQKILETTVVAPI